MPKGIEPAGTYLTTDVGTTNTRVGVTEVYPDGTVKTSSQWFSAEVETHGSLSIYPEIASPAVQAEMNRHVGSVDGFGFTGAYKNPLGIGKVAVSGEVNLNGSTDTVQCIIADLTGINRSEFPEDINLRAITKIVGALYSKEFSSLLPAIANNPRLSTRLGLFVSLIAKDDPRIPYCDIEGFNLGGKNIDEIFPQLGQTNYGIHDEVAQTRDSRNIYIGGDYPTTLEFFENLGLDDVIPTEGDSVAKYAVPQHMVTPKDRVGERTRFGFKTGKEPFGALVNRHNKKIILPFLNQSKVNDPTNVHYVYQQISDYIKFACQNYDLNQARMYFLPVEGGYHLVERDGYLYRASTEHFQINKEVAAQAIALRDLGVAYNIFNNLDPDPETERKIGLYSGMFARAEQDGNQIIFCAALRKKYIPHLILVPDSGVMSAFTIAKKELGFMPDPRSVMEDIKLPYETDAYPDYRVRWQHMREDFPNADAILRLPELPRSNKLKPIAA